METLSDERLIEVLEQLGRWTPTSARGEAALARFRQWLPTAHEPFSRNSAPEHITGSAVVLSSAGVLLHRHKLSGMWIGPGGHVDGPTETPSQGAVRETLEETGLRAWHPWDEPVIVNFDAHETTNGHLHYDFVYLLVAPPDVPSPPEGESPDVRWFEPTEALTMGDESNQASIGAALGLDPHLP